MKQAFSLVRLILALTPILAVSSCSFDAVAPLQPKDLCNCIPFEPDTVDYRHAAKHVTIPSLAPIETDIATILAWPQDLALPPDAPRTGRELQVFHVAQSFLQNASVNSGDCDIHLELSGTANKSAPRVVVETPVDANFCPARQGIQSQLQQRGFRLDATHGGEIPTAIPAEVTGLALEDFEHNRGSSQVSTLWELHPAQVTLH